MEIYINKKDPILLAEDGIPLAEAQIALPHADGNDRASRAVNRFYDRIGRALEAIAHKTLPQLSRELYTRSDDPRKKFTHRPFRLSCECHLENAGDQIIVRRYLAVNHRGHTVHERKDSERITKEGLILPCKNQKK